VSIVYSQDYPGANPDRSPGFRSPQRQERPRELPSPFGVPPDIIAFHRYTGNSTLLYRPQVWQYRVHFLGWAEGFHTRLSKPPASPLRPVILVNACTLRVNRDCWHVVSRCFLWWVTYPPDRALQSRPKIRSRPSSLTRRRCVRVSPIAQDSPLLPPTSGECKTKTTTRTVFGLAFFRVRRRGRVSVPVWLAVLRDQLPVVGLVSHYLTNYLIGRGPIPKRRSGL
jgi:hypothetical protein